MTCRTSSKPTPACPCLVSARRVVRQHPEAEASEEGAAEEAGVVLTPKRQAKRWGALSTRGSEGLMMIRCSSKEAKVRDACRPVLYVAPVNYHGSMGSDTPTKHEGCMTIERERCAVPGWIDVINILCFRTLDSRRSADVSRRAWNCFTRPR